MISAEEFGALKKRIDSLEALVDRLAMSHKDVLEKYLPEAVNGLNKLIATVAASQTESTNRLTELATGIGTLATAVDRIQDELEFPTG